jgi:hypothetical protein
MSYSETIAFSFLFYLRRLGERNVIGVWFFYFSTHRWNDGTLIFSKVFTQFSIFENRVFIILDIISYNITSGMIIIDDFTSPKDE